MINSQLKPRLRWRVVNSVYAGWKQLLASDTKSIDGGDLNAFHAFCGYREGDRTLPETWPNNPPKRSRLPITARPSGSASI